MVYGWKAFPPKLGIGRRFKPAYTRDGIIILTLGITTQLPGGRPRPAGSIHKGLHGFGPRYHLPALLELLFPELRLGITTGIDKLFKGPVRNFCAVNEEIIEFH